MGVAIKGQHRDAWGKDSAPYVDPINPSILCGILFYSCARCYYWGKLSKDIQDLTVYLFCNCMCIYKHLKMFNLQV